MSATTTTSTSVLRGENFETGIIHKHDVVTLTGTTSPTAAQWLSGFINLTAGGAQTWTLPTGVALADAMPGDTVEIGDTFSCWVVNDSGGILTFDDATSVAGATLDTIPQAALTVADTLHVLVVFRFITATANAEAYVATLFTPTIAT